MIARLQRHWLPLAGTAALLACVAYGSSLLATLYDPLFAALVGVGVVAIGLPHMLWRPHPWVSAGILLLADILVVGGSLLMGVDGLFTRLEGFVWIDLAVLTVLIGPFVVLMERGWRVGREARTLPADDARDLADANDNEAPEEEPPPASTSLGGMSNQAVGINPTAVCGECGATLRPGEVLFADNKGKPVVRAWHCIENDQHPEVNLVEDADWRIRLERPGLTLKPGWWRWLLLLIATLALVVWWMAGQFGLPFALLAVLTGLLAAIGHIHLSPPMWISVSATVVIATLLWLIGTRMGVM